MSEVLTPPIDAASLQDWVSRSFQTFTGPPRAYFELPIRVEGMNLIKRVVYLTVVMHGDSEIAAVMAMQKRFEMAAGHGLGETIFSDASFALFFRRPFEWNAEEKMLTARLSFWEEERNRFFPLREAGSIEIMDPLLRNG